MKSKPRIKYVCSNCGYESLRWLGKCPECEEWNSFSEEIIENRSRKTSSVSHKIPVSKINEISAKEDDRIRTGIKEFDRVLGGLLSGTFF